MANEIYTRVELTARKNGANVTASPAANLSMTGAEMLQLTQPIGTTSELLTLGDITGAPAFILIQNLDSTNFVEIGGDSGLTVFKLKILPGQSQLISPSSGTVYAKANTSTVRILKVAAEA